MTSGVLYFVHLAKEKTETLSLWGQITNTSSTVSWIIYLNVPSVNRTHNGKIVPGILL